MKTFTPKFGKLNLGWNRLSLQLFSNTKAFPAFKSLTSYFEKIIYSLNFSRPRKPYQNISANGSQYKLFDSVSNPASNYAAHLLKM